MFSKRASRRQREDILEKSIFWFGGGGDLLRVPLLKRRIRREVMTSKCGNL